MRLGLVLAIAMAVLAAPTQTLAQGRSAGGSTPMGDLMNLNQFATRGFMNQWSATRPAALSGLSRLSRRWIKAEVERQALAPRPVREIAARVEATIGPDIRRMAKSERIEPADVRGAVLLKILVDTHSALAREARRDPTVPPGARPWDIRIAEADLNVREAIAMQSETALAMARD